MIVPGATVFLTAIPPKKPPARSRAAAAPASGEEKLKCSHAVQISGDPREGGGLTLVGCHPQQAEKITRQVSDDALSLTDGLQPSPPCCHYCSFGCRSPRNVARFSSS
jgi:hypothetical protein